MYSTYLGGSGYDRGLGIVVVPSGNAYVTGETLGNFPTTNEAYQTVFGGAQDAFMAILNGTGTGLVYSTYLGGDVSDAGNGIVVDSSGNVFVTGLTAGSFPTTGGAYQTNFGGGSSNAFVTKFDVSAFYTPTPTVTLTSTVTPTPTITLTSTITNTPTITFTPTATPTITFTPTITSTLTSTPTPGYSGPNPPKPGTSFVYPSPAMRGTVNIAYDMQESGTAQVLVWNESAELVADVSQSQWSGPQKTTLNIQGWARGVYFYRVVLHYNSGKEERLKPDKFLIGWL